MPSAKSPSEILRRLIDRMVGHAVTDTCLAANSFYFDVKYATPSETDLTLWVEPSWQFGDSSGVQAGSMQAQVENEEAHSRLGALLARICGKRVEDIAIESLTNSVHIKFEGGYWLRTFVCDPASGNDWSVYDRVTRTRLVADSRGLAISGESLRPPGGGSARA